MTVECDFPRPPGGKLVCEPGQAAFIEIRGGQITATCRTPPSSLHIRIGGGYSPEFKAWVLAVARHQLYRRTDWLSPEDEALFAMGAVEYIDDYGRRVRVEFKTPGLGKEPEGGGQVAAM